MNDRFIHPFIHQINTYSACYILGTILGGGNISEQNRKTKQKQKKKKLALSEFNSSVGDR